MFKKMNFDPAKDLVPVSLIEKGPLVLMVPANSPFKSVKDIMAAAKASPGKLSFASGGLGGVDMMFEQMYSAAPSIRAGKLRALAITSRTRSPLFPDLPTMAESGVPGFEVQNWQGLVAPAGTPAALIKLLNETTSKALADPTIREQMLGQGNELGGGTPEQFASFIKSEADRWGKLVKSANIKPE